MASVGESTVARQRGNDFYRKGQFAHAEKAYRKAASLAPQEPAPWSNISAIKFEQGDYSAALQSIHKAVALTTEPDESPAKQKLYTRMAKCHLYNLDLQDAEAAAAKLTVHDQSRALKSSINELQALWKKEPKEGPVRKDILDRFPRYKGVLRDDPEYYPMGHDNLVDLYDKALQSETPARTDLAFLICGSGDARHLFHTLLSISAFGFHTNRASGRDPVKAHITILDINAASLAKTLIMLDMFMMYAVSKVQKQPRIEDALTVMAYTYSSAFVPSFVVMKMMEHIRKLISLLEEDGESPGTTAFGFIYLPRSTRTQVLRKLKQWAEPLTSDYAMAKLAHASKVSFWPQWEI